MVYVNPFAPSQGANTQVTASGTSASLPVNKDALSVRIVNSGAGLAYVRLGQGTATASAIDTPVRANSDLILTKSAYQDVIAYFSSAGTTLDIQSGMGGV